MKNLYHVYVSGAESFEVWGYSQTEVKRRVREHLRVDRLPNGTSVERVY